MLVCSVARSCVVAAGVLSFNDTYNTTQPCIVVSLSDATKAILSIGFKATSAVTTSAMSHDLVDLMLPDDIIIIDGCYQQG